MNVAGGYWVLSTEPSAVGHVQSRSLAVGLGDRVLLCSDGFSRVRSWFSAYPRWADIAGLIERGQGELIIAKLRALENEHPMMGRVPNVARHDDATALLLEVATA
jgi:hypothetical protein